MSQRRMQLVVSNRSVNVTALSQVRCAMLSARLPELPPALKKKLQRIQRRRPAVLVVIEKLADDVLTDLGETI
jgi:hypothetical protein